MMWFGRWATDRVKNRMWPQLGWFSGLVFAGSVAGAVAWVAEMQSNTFEFESTSLGVTSQRFYNLDASSDRWYAIFFIFYELEFMCLIIPKLMLLSRLSNSSVRGQQNKVPLKFGCNRGTVYILMVSSVVLFGVVAMVALYESAVFYLQAALILDQASAACDTHGHDTNLSLALFRENVLKSATARTALSVQSVFEALVLLVISVAFAIRVAMSVAAFRGAERAALDALADASGRGETAELRRQTRQTAAALDIVNDTMRIAAEQRRRLVAACLIVLIAFPVRAAYDLLQALANFAEPLNPACGDCESCQSDRYLIHKWLIYTPEFQPIVVALSSPLPLVVSLWLITSAHAQAFAISLSVLRARLGKYLGRSKRANQSPLLIP